MVIETAAVSPFLLGYYAYLAATSATSFHVIASSDEAGVSWPLHLALLVGAGALTMIPLIMFASAARGLTLGTMGFLQYLGPTLQPPRRRVHLPRDRADVPLDRDGRRVGGAGVPERRLAALFRTS